MSKTNDVLQVIYSYVYGPFDVPLLGENKYFVLMVDDFSRKLWIYLTKAKNEVFKISTEFKILVENQSGKSIKVIRSDGGGEFTKIVTKEMLLVLLTTLFFMNESTILFLWFYKLSMHLAIVL